MLTFGVYLLCQIRNDIFNFIFSFIYNALMQRIGSVGNYKYIAVVPMDAAVE